MRQWGGLKEQDIEGSWRGDCDYEIGRREIVVVGGGGQEEEEEEEEEGEES
jgi:hypothetical protein